MEKLLRHPVLKNRILFAMILLSMLGTVRGNSGERERPGTAQDSHNGMVFIHAAGRSFVMGSQGVDNAIPHTVRFTYDFWIGGCEVTRREYCRVMNGNPSQFVDSDSLPVETVTWYDAVLFCNALSKKEGFDTVYAFTGTDMVKPSGNELSAPVIHYEKNGFRLPTEAEWEFACRAGTKSEYFWGEDSGGALNYCWFLANSARTTQKVGLKKPNGFGLFDMAGNVGEWCSDLYGAYPSGLSINPIGPQPGEYRMVRGGAWNHTVQECRSASRGFTHPTNRTDYIGFRLCRGQLRLPAKELFGR